MANYTHLQVLDLRKNGLTGELLGCLIYFHELRVLSVVYNDLHGGIPQWITNLTKLQVLDLSNNKFGGRIPHNLDRLQGFAVNGTSKLIVQTLYVLLTVDMK